MLEKIIDGCCLVLKVLMGACLALMVLLVFGNVVMRYAFNSGITLSEELSRWLFVWMTFLGAVVALREHGHLGTDMLLGRIGPGAKRVCLGLAHVLMLWVCGLLVVGAWKQAVINLGSTSAVMEVSMAWLYAPCILFAVLGGIILLMELWQLLTGRLRDEDLVMIQESEESPHAPAGKR